MGRNGRIFREAFYSVLYCLLVIIFPMILFYKESLSFNVVGEIADSSPFSKRFNLVVEHYEAGKMMTTTVVIESDKALDNNESLSVIDILTDNIKKLSGGEKVSSVTQPEGILIKDFYMGSRLNSVACGLSQ